MAIRCVMVASKFAGFELSVEVSDVLPITAVVEMMEVIGGFDSLDPQGAQCHDISESCQESHCRILSHVDIKACVLWCQIFI